MAQYFEAVGRRKESTARVRVTEGSGVFTVNEKQLDVYFPRTGDAPMILKALEAAGQNPTLTDVSVKVEGGGVSGQRDAVKLGLAQWITDGSRDGIHALNQHWPSNGRR